MNHRIMLGRIQFSAVCVLLLPLAACTIDVQENGSDRKGNVDIRTPVGAVSVRTDVDRPDTGMPVYPGATQLRDGREPESANVNVGAFGFGVKVVAAKYESADGEQAILDFYKDSMKSFGTVTECRGNVDFRRNGPVCRSKPSDREVQLVAGTRDNQHIVGIKPRGDGSELSLVHVQTSGVD
jgi:hypothetical protein